MDLAQSSRDMESSHHEAHPQHPDNNWNYADVVPYKNMSFDLAYIRHLQFNGRIKQIWYIEEA